MSQIPTWRFYQGLRNEWRWYKLHDTGLVIAGSDRAFAELTSCMANAEHAGFERNGTFQVHARSTAEAEEQALPIACTGAAEHTSAELAA